MIPAIDVVVSPTDPRFVEFVIEAERLGVRRAWVPEFWGPDAFTALGALAHATTTIGLGTAIVPLASRTPASLAMASGTMQSLSDGRFTLGVGTSGPQVVEGWHGVEFDRPIRRTREAIDIVRLVASGERLVYDGEVHRHPRPGGEGAAIRYAGGRFEVAIQIAALGPRNLELTGEIADGWIGTAFLCETADEFLAPMRRGAERAGRRLDDLDLNVGVSCEFGDDLDEIGRRHAAGYAFTIGAMGSATSNFYNAAFRRQGLGERIDEVERLWRDGDRDAARSAVPMEIGMQTNLLGPPTDVRRRLEEYAAAGIDALRVSPVGDDLDTRLDTLGRLVDLTADGGPP